MVDFKKNMYMRSTKDINVTCQITFFVGFFNDEQ
jgi:hypothetical protein